MAGDGWAMASVVRCAGSVVVQTAKELARWYGCYVVCSVGSKVTKISIKAESEIANRNTEYRMNQSITTSHVQIIRT
jgi:hypothetical protein